MSKAAEAVELFRNGCACSQAVLTVYGAPYGLDRPTAMRLAAGFAGGMRLGRTCGAVTGAVMVLGLRHGGDDCERSAGRQAVNAAVRDFVARFERRNGSSECRAILGCDISTPEGLKSAQDQGLFKTVCPKMVRDAGEILEEMR